MKGHLPDRAGVGASHVQVTAGLGSTALAFLQARFPAIDAAEWKRRFADGRVTDAGGQALAENAPVRVGTDLYYYRDVPAEPRIPFEAEIVWRDEHLLVVDKPHFLPVTPSGRFVRETLLARLRDALDLPALVPLHRIDRGTAGLVLFSIEEATRHAYQALFPRREMLKTYEAVAAHRADLSFPHVHRSRLVESEPFFRMRETDGEPNSETRIEILERRGTENLYRLFPVTGRKHQLRVHLAALGIPITGDPLYPELLPETADDYASPMKLLARALEFIDPLDGRPRRFESRRSL